MAQIRNFTSTNDSYFILDGVSYPKVYEAMLDNGYTKDKIKLVGTNRDNSPLVFSTHYSNIRVDGASFASAQEAISRLNEVVFSKGGGSGDGGTTGDYIPLSGTEEGKPVIGDVKINNDGSISFYDITNDTYVKLWCNDGFYIEYLGNLIEMSGNYFRLNGITELSSSNDNSDINPSNKLIYAQRSYVDRANSYFTEETLTGGTWIDGKPIYKKYITVDIPANNSNPVGYVMTNCTIIDFEKAYLKTLESDYAHAHGKGDNSIYDWSFSKDVTNGQLLVAPKTTHTTIRTVSGVLFYTKTTD